MRIVGLIVVLLIVLASGSSYYLLRPAVDGRLEAGNFESLSVASPESALTLARARSGNVLLVTGVDADGVSAVDLNAHAGRAFDDALQAYEELGVARLRTLYQGEPLLRVPWGDLVQPLQASYPQVAAGTNFRAHAEEVGHEGEPFLFPKLSHPTPWNGDVLSGARLDYEVELCAVPLSDHSEQAPAVLGYLLCGDFTDRWLLVRHIDPGGVMGRTGFPEAKGGPSRLPVGPLLLIPYDDAFYRELELSLYVNDTLRQRASAGEMIWSPRQILSRALSDCRSPYHLGNEIMYLGDCKEIPAGTLILTGTPAGVLFHLATVWNPWVYLRAGDVVTSFGTHLGYLRNSVVED